MVYMLFLRHCPLGRFLLTANPQIHVGLKIRQHYGARLWCKISLIGSLSVGAMFHNYNFIVFFGNSPKCLQVNYAKRSRSYGIGCFSVIRACVVAASVNYSIKQFVLIQLCTADIAFSVERCSIHFDTAIILPRLTTKMVLMTPAAPAHLKALN